MLIEKAVLQIDFSFSSGLLMVVRSESRPNKKEKFVNKPNASFHIAKGSDLTKYLASAGGKI